MGVDLSDKGKSVWFKPPLSPAASSDGPNVRQQQRLANGKDQERRLKTLHPLSARLVRVSSSAEVASFAGGEARVPAWF